MPLWEYFKPGRRLSSFRFFLARRRRDRHHHPCLPASASSEGLTMRLCCALAVGLLLAWQGPGHADEKRKPNVIVILVDDVGYGEFGFQGNKDVPTPHIDSIAKNGVRFTNGYVSGPYCSPTRAGLLTGRYQT